jgi:hypothetical protein
MPPLASVADEAVNFAVGLMKQPPRQHKDGAMGVRAALQHKMYSGGGRIETIHPRHIRIELMGSRGRGSTGRRNNQLFGGEGKETRHNNIVLKSGAA